MVPGGFGGDAGLRARAELHQVEAGARAEHESRGREDARLRAGSRDHSHGETAIGGRLAVARVEDMAITLAVGDEGAIIIAGSGHRMIGDRNSAPTLAGTPGIFQPDMPGAAARESLHRSPFKKRQFAGLRASVLPLE